MIYVQLSKGFATEGTGDFEAHCDLVMEELLRLETVEISDVELSAELATKIVTITVVAMADTFENAITKADGVIRTAIHAAGGHTPEWQHFIFAPQSQVANLVNA